MEAGKSKHEGMRRAFTHTGAAWYAKSALQHGREIDEVVVGMYHPQGGTSGEFAVRWYELCGKVTPRLEVFDDSWDVLQKFSDVLAAMAEVDDKDIGPEQFCVLLTQRGVIDQTDRIGPEKKKAEVDPQHQLIDALRAAQHCLGELRPHYDGIRGRSIDKVLQGASEALSNAGQQALGAPEADAASRFDWLQQMHTLHRTVEVLYVVDGYEVTICWDGDPISPNYHGKTLVQAIDKARMGFDANARPKWVSREGDPASMAEQLAEHRALNAQLVAALKHVKKRIKNGDYGTMVDLPMISDALAAAGAA